MKRNICRVLVVALLLTTAFAIANLGSLIDAFGSMYKDSENNIVNAHSIEGAYLALEFDKDKGQVGDIIVAEINAYDVENLAAFQINVKYDPEVLEAINPDTGALLKSTTMPKRGNILVDDNYDVFSIAANDIGNGILNFARSYTHLEEYRVSGKNESTGTLATIGFRVLKEESTVVGFADTPTMPKSISGTMLYDYNAEKVTNYITSQPCTINGEDSNGGGSNGSISLELDKNSASVGDIINATIKIDNIDYLSAYQINIKYDSEILQAVNPNTLRAFETGTMPEGGTLVVNEKYGPISTAANDIEKGILNFGKVYSLINDYRTDGKAESNTGTVGTIAFKVLKGKDTSISFENTVTMPNSISGTMLYDWNTDRLTNYSVIQPGIITLSQGTETPEDPTKPTDSYIEIELDKTSAKVGEIIKAYVNVENITNFAAYQLNIKYDPTILEAVDAKTGKAYARRTVPVSGDILENPEYGSVSAVNNEIEEGIINFAKTYTHVDVYRENGNPEETGNVAVIGFKVLKEESTDIRFAETNTMPNSISGTYLYDWYVKRLSNYKVIQPKTINDGASGGNSDEEPEILENNVSISIDKDTASVGEIITATFLVKGVENLAGYQLNIEYDAKVLEPIQPSGEVYGMRTIPGGGTLINNETYNPLTIASNDLTNGKLCFGKIYVDLFSLKNSGKNEGTGVLGEISFKVLSKEKTEIYFEEVNTVLGKMLGATLYDWDGDLILDYTIQKSVIIN